MQRSVDFERKRLPLIEVGAAATPLVAVCVCTRARPQMLRRCIASLRRQHCDPARFRVKFILIDNNAQPTSRPDYDELCECQETNAYVHCPHPGIPTARNAGLEAALRAGADFIAILDDDEVAPQHWLSLLMQALEESGADAVQGGVCKHPPNAEHSALQPAAPGEKLSWEASETLSTCNVLLKARLVEPPLSLRFDETMQFTGGSDREFFMRAHKRGAKLLRVHGIDVIEDAHQERQSLRYQAVRAFAAGSNYFVRMTKNEPGVVAAARIASRATERSLSGMVMLAGAAALVVALRPDVARKQGRKACLSLCFAAGCLTPLAGVRAYPYRNTQGA